YKIISLYFIKLSKRIKIALSIGQDTDVAQPPKKKKRITPVTIPNINLFSDNELILNPVIAIESPEATTSKSTVTTTAISHVASSFKSTATTPKSKAKSMAKSMATTPKLTATT